MSRWLNFVGLLGLLPSNTIAAPSPNRDDLCQAINKRFPGTVGFANSTQYEDSQQHYFALDERAVTPRCVFRPKSTQDVAEFVKIAASYAPDSHGPPNGQNDSISKPLFAIRSGGHSLWKGAANAEDGLTLDMRGFDSFKLSKDKKVASIGGGTNFGATVYPNLQPHNLTVVGARLIGVAAGGFLSGGGKNYFSRKYGFGCDNIYGYEVVLANGKIVYASSVENRDLWLALKGGSNNFGIITRYDVATYKLDGMWGGINTLSYSPESLDYNAQAYHDFMLPGNFDDSADLGVLLGFFQGTFFLQNTLFYSKPEANATCFKNFTAIPSITESALHFNSIVKIAQGDGLVVPATIPRSFELVFAFRNTDASTYRSLFQLWQDGISKIGKVDGLQIQYLLQPMPVTNGTNSLGLPANGRDISLWVFTGAWNNAADDEAVITTMQSITDQSEAALKKQGLLLPYKYLNYADVTQNPISTYGKENIQRLWAASKKYDPKGLWQKHVPGYKLPTKY